MIKREVFKPQIMADIRRSCEQSVKYEAEQLFIYYTGHGCKNTGNWVTAKPPGKKILKSSEWNIKIEEVFEMIRESGFDQNVIIVSDCCYSGEWCYQADKLQSNKKTKLDVKTLVVTSSCSRDREARWGAYSRMKELTSKPDMNKHTRNKIIRAYQNQFGIVTYNSEFRDKKKIQDKKPLFRKMDSLME